MRRRSCRAQGRDRVLDTVLRERHDVHIALDDDDAAGGPDRTPRLHEPVELAALLEECRLGRVEVFGTR